MNIRSSYKSKTMITATANIDDDYVDGDDDKDDVFYRSSYKYRPYYSYHHDYLLVIVFKRLLLHL